jgi:hypothetical protein
MVGYGTRKERNESQIEQEDGVRKERYRKRKEIVVDTVKLPLCLIMHHCIKTYNRREE